MRRQCVGVVKRTFTDPMSPSAFAPITPRRYHSDDIGAPEHDGSGTTLDNPPPVPSVDYSRFADTRPSVPMRVDLVEIPFAESARQYPSSNPTIPIARVVIHPITASRISASPSPMSELSSSTTLLQSR